MAHVIVPLDGSQVAERALPLAARIARLTGSGLRLVQAPLTPGSLQYGPVSASTMADGHEYLDDEEVKLRERYGLATSTRTAISSPAELILDEAGSPDAVAVVMSTHGRTGLVRLVMGSVAERVVRESPIPVYLLPPGAGTLPDGMPIRRILVPLDGSAVAYSVLAAVPQLARSAGAEVRLFRVFSAEGRPERRAEDYFRPIQATLHASGIAVRADWTTGAAAEEILIAADLSRADLIAMATHGRSGLERLRHGSVAEAVLRRANVPAMTFGPQALKRLAAGVGPLAAAEPLPEALVTTAYAS